MDVDYVGRTIIAGTDRFGNEWSTGLDGVWIKVETPTPLHERWINTYPDGYTAAYSSKASADMYAGEGVITVHIWTDADGVDRIERVTA